MALIKDFYDERGVPTSYWKIAEVKNTKSLNNTVQIDVQLDGFYNKQARIDGKLKRCSLVVTFTVDIFEVIPNINLLSAYYYQIVALVPDFTGAVSDEMIE